MKTVLLSPVQIIIFFSMRDQYYLTVFVIYVDDMAITGNCPTEIQQLKYIWLFNLRSTTCEIDILLGHRCCKVQRWHLCVPVEIGTRSLEDDRKVGLSFCRDSNRV